MTLQDDLHKFINEDAEVATLLGGRLFPLVLPQSAQFPAATIQVVSTRGGHTMQGADGLDSVQFQIDCYSPTVTEAQDLAAAVRQRIDGFKGSMGVSDIRGVFFQNSRESYDADLGNEKLYRVSSDYEVWAR